MPFYHPNSPDLEKITFINNTLNLNNVYKSIIIREKQDYYEIAIFQVVKKLKKTLRKDMSGGMKSFL